MYVCMHVKYIYIIIKVIHFVCLFVAPFKTMAFRVLLFPPTTNAHAC